MPKVQYAARGEAWAGRHFHRMQRILFERVSILENHAEIDVCKGWRAQDASR
jgi:hypothetical protein